MEKDLFNQKTGKFNISKLPDIYDSIKYDMLHNRELLEKVYPTYGGIYELSQVFAYFVVPSEYGMCPQTKLITAKKTVTPLFRKIYNDLMFWKGEKGNE